MDDRINDNSALRLRKMELRARAKALRKAVAARRAHMAASRVLHHGIALLDYTLRDNPGLVVAGYHPIRDEVDPRPLLLALHSASAIIALPAIASGLTLSFRKWVPGGTLAKGKFGLLQPGEHNEEVSPQIVLVPLLAFDRAGNRLGYGAGYYDATLAALRAEARVIAAGLAYDEQEFKEIPCESTDQRLDYVLTPSGIIRCGD